MIYNLNNQKTLLKLFERQSITKDNEKKPLKKESNSKRANYMYTDLAEMQHFQCSYAQ